jgi:hypothetical protein
VEGLLNLVGSGWTLEQIQEDFPFVEAADIQQRGRLDLLLPDPASGRSYGPHTRMFRRHAP